MYKRQAEYIELFDFRAFGEQKTKTVAASVSGTYATNYGNFHLQQEGASVFGCYEHGGGLVTNGGVEGRVTRFTCCLLYTSDAADERSSVDLGGRRIIKKKTTLTQLPSSHV